jgi:hypothetical protein
LTALPESFSDRELPMMSLYLVIQRIFTPQPDIGAACPLGEMPMWLPRDTSVLQRSKTALRRLM